MRALPLLLIFSCHSAPPTPVAPVRKTITMPTTLHILTLGDSLAYGAGDESGEGITGRLDDELRARGIGTVETANFGVNGARTSDVLTRLRTKKVREAVAGADAVVLSIGANDLFRTPSAREELLRSPLEVAERILASIETIVHEIHTINPRARVLLLGGYNPVPRHERAATINQYLGIWDEALSARFETDARVAIVRMADIVTPQRLSRHDSFHPGSAAYQEAAKRIAAILIQELSAA